MGHAMRAARPLATAATATCLTVAMVGCAPLRDAAPTPSPSSTLRVRDVVGYLDRYGLNATGADWTTARDEALRLHGDEPIARDASLTISRLNRLAGGRHSHLDLTPATPTIATPSSGPRPTVTQHGGVTTIVVPGDEDYPEDHVVADSHHLADQIKQQQSGTCGWILDLRNNSGGSIANRLIGLTPLLPDGPAIVLKDRDGTTRTSYTITGTGLRGQPWPPPLTATPAPAPFTMTGKTSTAPKATQPIAVLQNERTGSAGEALLLAFRGLPNTRSFGRPTAGYSTGNAAEQLPGGATMILSVAVMADRTGTDFHGGQIPPDHATLTDPAATDAATNWLRQQGCT